MTRSRNLDDLLREWVDDGAERLPQQYLAAALAEVDTTPQQGARRASLEGILMRLQPLAVPIGIAAALVLAIGAFALAGWPPSVGPQPSAVASEPIASRAPSAAASDIAPRAASEAVVEQLRGPVSLSSFGTWVAKSRDAGLGVTREPGGLNGYLFTPDSTGRWFTIYLDPGRDYGATAATDGTALQVLIGWNFSSNPDPAQRGSGSFRSERGECEVRFEQFTDTAIEGTLECADIPGTYATGASGGTREGLIEVLRATFSFDPVADAYVLPSED